MYAAKSDVIVFVFPKQGYKAGKNRSLLGFFKNLSYSET